MKLACFTMLRNESPILGPFIDQLLAFFDYAAVLDHGSTDESVDIVRDRGGERIELFHLKAAGYPQSEVSTFFAHRIFDKIFPDFLFFLDCDEFLPFKDRSELETFLSEKTNFDLVRFYWVNLCPGSLVGGDIFASGGFVRAPTFSPIPKVVISRTLARRGMDWSLLQGNHGVTAPHMEPIQIFEVADRGLFHIPVQSRGQFMFKVAAGSKRLRREQTNLRKGQGTHWVRLADEVASRHLDDAELRLLALGYPALLDGAASPLSKLNFDFPYVRSAYRETASYIGGSVRNLMNGPGEDFSDSGTFTIVDDEGAIVSSAGPAALARNDKCLPMLPPGLFDTANSADAYAALIEPLFNLPAKLPLTAWVGHIPFLFVLFRALRPNTFVELGVHKGASLIAACTAATTYQFSTRLTGVDTWQGDAHARYSDGDEIFRELQTYLSATFPKATLERCYFADALPRFLHSTIDILHIDGLHSYDAVKEDFTNWFDRVSPLGVILLHDIAVYDRGFGVHRLWAQLRERFATLEFPHSHGLGVVILTPDDPRLAPLMALRRDPKAWQFYQSLVADIANGLPERMVSYAPSNGSAWPELEEARASNELAQRQLSEVCASNELAQRQLSEVCASNELAQRQLSEVYASTSWRATAPLRAVRRMMGC